MDISKRSEQQDVESIVYLDPLINDKVVPESNKRKRIVSDSTSKHTNEKIQVRNKKLNKTDLNISQVHAEKQKEKQLVLEEVIPSIYKHY